MDKSNTLKRPHEKIRLAIVCPCYNEHEALPISAGLLRNLMDSMVNEGLVAADSYVLWVNDGSRDNTWEIIKNLHAADPLFHGLNLAHNVGHQNAIMAGMLESVDTADAVVTIDADLQDDIMAIPRMVRQYYDGYDVVYGVKVSRVADPPMKRFTAQMFYKLMKRFGVETIYNHADFRFMSKRVVMELARYGERNLYLRGIIPMIGFPSTTVEDVISERKAGQSKYTLTKMLTLAMNGITSFSITPIYAIIGLGGVFLLTSIFIGIYVLVSLISGNAEHGWSSLMLSIWFVGGMILLSLGVVGLYVGRVYVESKQRPLYHIQDRLS
ncbi:MAG: glycosyltransferase family 2 protein [Candidatus Amulumruptor caecigallinarius]|nr:glycosyltransferase family 2 protein [Candidatus Amulumruptor caecigallinarius]